MFLLNYRSTSQDIYRGKVFTLKKPKVGMVASDGFMTINSDKVVLSFKNIYSSVI